MDQITHLLNPTTLITFGIFAIILPIFAIVGTSFAKIVIILNILRSAIGANQVPPSYVMNVIAGAISAFIMAAPISQSMEIAERTQADISTLDGSIVMATALAQPFANFMTRNTGKAEREFFEKIRLYKWSPETQARFSESSAFVVLPAFVISEVRRGFEAGFLLYIPFTIIDVVTATIITALGMSSVSPNIISIPLKLVLFVFVDGWTNLADKLIGSYM